MQLPTMLFVALVAALPNALADGNAATAECSLPCTAPSMSAGIPLPDDCSVQPGWDGGIDCDRAEVCSMLNATTCWTLRLSCYYLEQPMQGLLGMECQTQPEGNVSEPSGNCNNYGILVAVHLWGSKCSGESCQNHGILATVGSYCDHPFVDVCAGSLCLWDLCAEPVLAWAADPPTTLSTHQWATPTTAPTQSNEEVPCGV